VRELPGEVEECIDFLRLAEGGLASTLSGSGDRPWLLPGFYLPAWPFRVNYRCQVSYFPKIGKKLPFCSLVFMVKHVQALLSASSSVLVLQYRLAFGVLSLSWQPNLLQLPRQEDGMSTQTIELSNLNLEVLDAFYRTDSGTPKETTVAEKKQVVPDEFEIRRKLFFGA
jgi:hypothetical protein